MLARCAFALLFVSGCVFVARLQAPTAISASRCLPAVRARCVKPCFHFVDHACALPFADAAARRTRAVLSFQGGTIDEHWALSYPGSPAIRSGIQTDKPSNSTTWQPATGALPICIYVYMHICTAILLAWKYGNAT